MKKNTQILKNRPKLSLGDLILAVGSCTKNTKETVAAVADLLGSGQVRVEATGASIALAFASRLQLKIFRRSVAQMVRRLRDVSFCTK